MIEAVYDKWNKEHPNDKKERKDHGLYDIHHIIPYNKKGKTILSNLEPKLRSENKRLGDRLES